MAPKKKGKGKGKDEAAEPVPDQAAEAVLSPEDEGEANLLGADGWAVEEGLGALIPTGPMWTRDSRAESNNEPGNGSVPEPSSAILCEGFVTVKLPPVELEPEPEPEPEPTVVIAEEEMPIAAEDNMEDVQAKTMYQMVEDLSTGLPKRLLMFLTARQAELMMEGSMWRVLQALEIGHPAPKLIINLCKSPGSAAWIKAQRDVASTVPSGPRVDVFGMTGNLSSTAGSLNAPTTTGVLHPEHFMQMGLYPWEGGRVEAAAAEARLLTFMEEVVVPLATDTRAVVLCSAVKGECLLSDAFNAAAASCQSEWAHKAAPPFTTVGFCSELHLLYLNTASQSTWRQLLRGSRNWRKYHTDLAGLFQPLEDPVGPPSPKTNISTANSGSPSFDMHASLSRYIVCHSLGNTAAPGMALDRLRADIIRHLSLAAPSVALKTGSLQTLQPLLDITQSGTALMMLDMRDRNGLFGEILDRVMLIDQARDAQSQLSEILQAGGSADYLDACALAMLHKALNMQPASSTQKNHSFKKSPDMGASSRKVPLHVALKHIEQGHAEASAGAQPASKQKPNGTKVSPSKDQHQDLAPATVKQIEEVSIWFANHVYAAQWAASPDREEKEARGMTMSDIFSEQIANFASSARMLLRDRHLRCLNTSDITAGKEMVHELVQLERLPADERIEGLQVLRDAWIEFDSKVHLAERFKVLGKALQFLQLFLSGATIVVATLELLAAKNEDSQGLEMAGVSQVPFQWVAFVLALLTSFFVSVTAYLSPMQRWRRLRGACCDLEGTLWRYRARVGEFTSPGESLHVSNAPTAALRDYLASWRDELSNNADLSLSMMEKNMYPEDLHHGQIRGAKYVVSPRYAIGSAHDDYHSPAKPDEYVDYRLAVSLEFYQERLPSYGRARIIVQAVVFLCALVTAGLAQSGLASLAIITTTLGIAIVAWSCFEDYGSKLGRYSSAVTSLKNIQSWWGSLSDAERHVEHNILRLVEETESVLAAEYQAWASSSASISRKQNFLAASRSSAPASKGGQQKSSMDGVKGGETDSLIPATNKSFAMPV